MAVHRLRTPAQPAQTTSLAQRMERLRLDAEAVATEHIDALIVALNEAMDLADQVANGGEPYNIGVREIARRMHKEIAPSVLSLRAVRERCI
jgi:urocanate hydratase